MLNNREIALLVWLGVVLIVVISRRDLRPSLAAVVRAACAGRIVLAATAMVVYVAALVLGAHRVGLWSPALLKDTIVWFIGPAFVLFFNMTRVSEPGFFRRAALATAEVSVVVAFALNLFVMSLAWELVLQPVLFVLVAVSAYAGTDQQYAPAKRLCDGVLALLGFGLLIFVAVQAVAHWRELEPTGLSLDFLLPIWLTFGLLPFIFVMGLVSMYELLFLRVGFRSQGGRAAAHTRLALIAGLGPRLSLLRAFEQPWYWRVGQANIWREARAVVRHFKEQRRREADEHVVGVAAAGDGVGGPREPEAKP